MSGFAKPRLQVEEERLAFLNEEVARTEIKLQVVTKDLERQIQDRQTELVGLQGQIMKERGVLAGLRDQIESLKAEIDVANINNQVLKDSKHSLQSELSSLKSAIDIERESLLKAELLLKQVEDNANSITRQIEADLEVARKAVAEVGIAKVKCEEEQKRLNEYAVSLEQRQTALDKREVAQGLREKELEENKMKVAAEVEILTKRQKGVLDVTGGMEIARQEIEVLRSGIRVKESEIKQRDTELLKKESDFNARNTELRKREQDYVMRLAEFSIRERQVKIKEKSMGLVE